MHASGELFGSREHVSSRCTRPWGRRTRTGEPCQIAFFTSESVTEGHPDKICDQISDAILDALLEQDPQSRVAVETMVTTGLVHVAGEVTTKSYVDIPSIVRKTILDIGYDSSTKGFDGNSCGVEVSIGAQSADIAQGVDTAYEARVEAGEDPLDLQARATRLMFGYANDDTPELLPLPIWLAHRLAERLTEVRKTGEVPYLRPDGKTQVTIAYDGDKATRLDTVVVSSQHAADVSLENLLQPDIADHVIKSVLDRVDIDSSSFRLLVNPTGRFEIGGPMGDAGLTGRKIIVDTYGGSPGTVAARSPARIRRRWTARPRTRCAGWPRTWSPPVWPAAARCRSRTPSARRTRSACTSRPSAPRPSRWTASPRRSRSLRPAPGRDHPRPGPASPDLPPDRGLRSLRPGTARPDLGAHRPGQGPAVPGRLIAPLVE